MKCPGSVRLNEGLPRKTSAYAAEGIAAHALAEHCLLHLSSATPAYSAYYLGKEFAGQEVTKDMCEAVQVYLTYLAKLTGASMRKPKIHVEVRVSLENLDPPEEMFGTCDAVYYEEISGTLYVVDYKHGAGVAVEIKDNPQLRYYALGAMLTLPYRVRSVTMVLVQPRAEHPDGPIRQEAISAFELLEWGATLIDAAHAALPSPGASAPLNPGTWCRFCDAAPMCPALRETAKEVAQTEFAGTPLPLVERLTLVQMSEVLAQADLIEGWFRSIRSHLTDTLESGQEVPGWKLVPKRAVRRWADEAALTSWASEKGISSQLTNAPELKSPAQLEKSLGKNSIPSELIVKNSSGNKLAPSTDPRAPQVITSAADEFTAIP